MKYSHLIVSFAVGLGTFISQRETGGWKLIGLFILLSGLFYAGYSDREAER
jgi:steroid 5-alpha reductase family enzyme